VYVYVSKYDGFTTDFCSANPSTDPETSDTFKIKIKQGSYVTLFYVKIA